MPSNFLGEGCTKYLILLAIAIVISIIAYHIEGHWGEEQAVGLTPHAQAIRAYMEWLEGEGYGIERLQWGEEDPDSRLDNLVSYEVTDPGTGETWVYRWAIRFPAQYYFDGETEWIIMYPEECECRPLSEPAEAAHPYLDGFMPEWYKERQAESTESE